MNDLLLRYATVIDKSDPDEKGRIQVRILPELKDVKESLLPWADPYVVGSDSTNVSMHLPEEGQTVKVLVDKLFKYFYYIGGAYLDELFDYEGIESSLSSVAELSSSSYPDINFKLLSDGTVFFHNAVNGDVGIIQSTGTYLVVNDAGEIYLNVNGTVLSIVDGAVNLESDAITLAGESDNAVLWTQLNTSLQQLITTLSTHTHTDPLSGSTGPPASAITLDISGAKSTKVKIGG